MCWFRPIYLTQCDIVVLGGLIDGGSQDDIGHNGGHVWVHHIDKVPLDFEFYRGHRLGGEKVFIGYANVVIVEVVPVTQNKSGFCTVFDAAEKIPESIWVKDS